MLRGLEVILQSKGSEPECGPSTCVETVSAVGLTLLRNRGAERKAGIHLTCRRKTRAGGAVELMSRAQYLAHTRKPWLGVALHARSALGNGG